MKLTFPNGTYVSTARDQKATDLKEVSMITRKSVLQDSDFNA